MKRNKGIILILALFIVIYPTIAQAKSMALFKLLNKLTKPSVTSLQKLNMIEEYKGQEVEGSGRITDIIKSFGSENKAVIYIDKYYNGKSYELVLIADLTAVEKLKKGSNISFGAKFTDMSFNTIRLDNAEIIAKKWWWPF